jgi:predicted NBD/HSP70 family sugar kinase
MTHSQPQSATGDFIIAADLGGTNLRAASIGADGAILHQTKIRTPRTDQPDDIVRAFIEGMNECGERTVAVGGRVGALSIAVPGTIDARAGTVLKAPNVPSLQGFALGAAMKQASACPSYSPTMRTRRRWARCGRARRVGAMTSSC